MTNFNNNSSQKNIQILNTITDNTLTAMEMETITGGVKPDKNGRTCTQHDFQSKNKNGQEKLPNIG